MNNKLYMTHKFVCVICMNWDAHNMTLKIKIPKVIFNK